MNHPVIVLLLAARMLTLPAALHEMSIKSGVDPQLAACIVEHESGWDASLVGKDQDRGLFQIIPDTAEWTAGKLGYSAYDLLDPVQNMEFGLYILKTHPEWYSTLYLCEGAE